MNDIQTIIRNNPKACYRTLERLAWKELGYITGKELEVLAAARPECGYHCDGDEPNPRGCFGCTTSGRCEA